MFFRHFGEGEPVLILHGLFGLSDNWVPFAKKLSEKKYSVFIPDLRNHGRSPHSEEFNYEVLVNDLHEFIKEHNLENSLIIGHSMGGLIAMKFALRYPELIKRMVIIDIGIKNFPKYNLELMDAMLGLYISEMKSRNEIEAKLSEKINQKNVLELILKNIRRNSDNIFSWKLNLPALKNNLHNIFKSIEDKGSSEVEALFIAAGNSDYLSENDMPEIQKIFPCSIFSHIPEASHWVHAEKQDELFNEIINFI
ncbi:MAG TPA: alpha/beta fold hydrolase [Bacteroidales bacterium]|nr:alpha/beta fold hydrolase [Bacteroidales bacterium]